AAEPGIAVLVEGDAVDDASGLGVVEAGHREGLGVDVDQGAKGAQTPKIALLVGRAAVGAVAPILLPVGHVDLAEDLPGPTVEPTDLDGAVGLVAPADPELGILGAAVGALLARVPGDRSRATGVAGDLVVEADRLPPPHALVRAPGQHVVGRLRGGDLAVLVGVDAVVEVGGDLDHAARAVGDRDIAEQVDAGPRGVGVVGAGPGRVAGQLDRGLGVDLGDGALGAVGDPDDRERVVLVLTSASGPAVADVVAGIPVTHQIELGPAAAGWIVVTGLASLAVEPDAVALLGLPAAAVVATADEERGGEEPRWGVLVNGEAAHDDQWPDVGV